MLTLLVVLFAVVTFVGVFWHVALGVRYDLRETHQQKLLALHPHARHIRRRPQVSVIVLSRNHAGTIEQCLESIRRSTYRKVEIIVVDGASQDETKPIIRSYIQKHPRRTIKLSAKRRFTSYDDQIATGMRHAQGEIILTISAQQALDAHTIRSGIEQFLLDPSLAIVIPRRASLAHTNSAGMAHALLLQLWSRYQKNRSRFSHVARIGTFSTRAATRSGQVCYASTACVYEPSMRSWLKLGRALYQSQLRTLGRLRKGNLSVLLQSVYMLSLAVWIGYAVYIAVALQSPLLYLVAIVMLTVLAAEAIASDKQLPLVGKLSMVLLLPLTQLLLVLFTLAHYVALARVVFWPRRIRVST